MHLLVISWYKCWIILNMFSGMLKHYSLKIFTIQYSWRTCKQSTTFMSLHLYISTSKLRFRTTLYCVYGTYGICLVLRSAHMCILELSASLSITCRPCLHLMLTSVLGDHNCSGKSGCCLHMCRKCVFCDHLWALSSGRSLILWLLYSAVSLMFLEFVRLVFVLVEIFS